MAPPHHRPPSGGIPTVPTPKTVFPPIYRFLFIILEPTIIILSLFAILASPQNFISSLSHPTATGTGIFSLFTRLPKPKITSTVDTLSSPSALVLLQQFMGALAFSALIEPLVLFTATYRFESTRDAEMVIGAVLATFTAFDVFHAAATVSVVGWASVIPGLGGIVRWEACANIWVPVLWMGIRSCWFVGLGRQKVGGKEGKQKRV